MLALDGVDAYYGRAHILSEVSLAAEPGEVVVLLGRNGAGKSTTLKTAIGLVRAAEGRVRFDGHDVTRLASHQICRLGLGYVPEERRIFAELTVAENLEVGRQPPRQGVTPWTTERLHRLFPNLAEMHGRSARAMSGGEQQMLTIARTLMGNPRAILLDEPSEGLAPVIVAAMARAILELKREGLTVLLSEQNLRFAAAVADRAYIIEKGRIRFSGTMAALEAQPEIRSAYLTV
jgi:branched-chain amino acid transport system ATP-binding protein